MNTLESKRKSIFQRHRLEKQKRTTLLQWLRNKWTSFDSLIGGCIYDTNIEKFVLYFAYTLVVGLVLWGLILQLRQIVALLVHFTDHVRTQPKEFKDCPIGITQ